MLNVYKYNFLEWEWIEGKLLCLMEESSVLHKINAHTAVYFVRQCYLDV